MLAAARANFIHTIYYTQAARYVNRNLNKRILLASCSQRGIHQHRADAIDIVKEQRQTLTHFSSFLKLFRPSSSSEFRNWSRLYRCSQIQMKLRVPFRRIQTRRILAGRSRNSNQQLFLWQILLEWANSQSLMK